MYKANYQDEHVTIKDPKIVSQTLTEKAFEMQAVMPYRTIKYGEPPIRTKPATFLPIIEAQRKCSIIHALLVQTQMVIALMQLSRIYLPSVGFMPA